ncbi:MAG TPA: molybdopterin converting factor subunit 1 [Pirellulaceae bacterium]|nr:molybdopterin converting factor subunit 1 [Pirellulaceae bacterium]HMO93660.1 molybdopterin converting factor subunit 1 [Pirellulaceae bacterium]HMP70664.1 molybdopterin converting factor subunit 1 [Pirellulaceae bacterium]
MIIRVLFFAVAKDLCGISQVELALSEGATLADVKHQLSQQFPGIRELLPRCAFAVDQEYANDDYLIQAGCEVACIPPVSGG